MSPVLVTLLVLELCILVVLGLRLSAYRTDRPVKGPFGWPVAGPRSLLPSSYLPAGRPFFWALCTCVVIMWATVLWLLKLSNPVLP